MPGTSMRKSTQLATIRSEDGDRLEAPLELLLPRDLGRIVLHQLLGLLCIIFGRPPMPACLQFKGRDVVLRTRVVSLLRLGGWRTDIFLDFFQNRIKTKSFSKGGVVFQIYLNGQVGSSHFFNGWLGPVGR
jgi:hypothetical protein